MKEKINITLIIILLGLIMFIVWNDTRTTLETERLKSALRRNEKSCKVFPNGDVEVRL